MVDGLKLFADAQLGDLLGRSDFLAHPLGRDTVRFGGVFGVFASVLDFGEVRPHGVVEDLCRVNIVGNDQAVLVNSEAILVLEESHRYIARLLVIELKAIPFKHILEADDACVTAHRAVCRL